MPKLRNKKRNIVVVSTTNLKTSMRKDYENVIPERSFIN